MRAYNWNELPGHEGEGDGRVRRVVEGDRITILRQTIKKGFKMGGPHTHPHEQISIVMEGRARFTCEGESVELGPGGIVVFPGGSLHETQNIGGTDLTVEEVFSPVNEMLRKYAPK